MYSLIKFEHMISKHNPFVSEVFEENFLSSTDMLDLNDVDFKFAFSIEGQGDKEAKDDPRYVKIIV